ncbi:MAG: flavodoxin domain-containing protein [Candidatus Lokiarchaeota archaeon]|nr:flavodoxin domain-containing protein [Candidatus Lokiarchaeota archaeon]
MKIAILYDSKYGNTKKIAEFLTEKIHESGNDVQLFKTKETKPSQLFTYQPVALLVGGPTHFGKPTRNLTKYLKKLGKLNSPILKAAVFNCYTGDNVCKNIKEIISINLPKIELLEKSLPICTSADGNDWKKIALPNNWKDDASAFLSEFMNFLS